MGERLFFVNDQTKRKYEVVGKDPETEELILKGCETGVEFKQKFDKKQFKGLGYRLEKEEASDDEDTED